MREILFRGKREDAGKWVYGYYAHLPSAAGAADMIYVPASDPDDSNHTVFVDPETIGQFTGLTDKNGVKIFEGDIVKYGNTLHEVVFCDFAGNAYFGIWFADRGEIWPFSPSVPANRMTVIGNIYDNPELIDHAPAAAAKMSDNPAEQLGLAPAT